MGIILFLVDTSASMNQRTYLGASYLDVAKVAIETFMKVCKLVGSPCKSSFENLKLSFTLVTDYSCTTAKMYIFLAFLCILHIR